MKVENKPLQIFDFFFNRYDYLSSKGKGFSVFRSDRELVEEFQKILKRKNIDFSYYESETFRNKIENHDFKNKTKDIRSIFKCCIGSKKRATDA